MVNLSPKACAAADHVAVLPFKVLLHKGAARRAVLKVGQHLLYDIRFLFALFHTEGCLIQFIEQLFARHLSHGRRRAFFLYVIGVLRRLLHFNSCLLLIVNDGFFIVNRFLDFDDFLMARTAVLSAWIGYVRNTNIMAPVRINFYLAIRHRFPPFVLKCSHLFALPATTRISYIPPRAYGRGQAPRRHRL